MNNNSSEAFFWAAQHMRRGSISSAKETEAFLDAANMLEQQAEHLEAHPEVFYFCGHAALETK